MPSFHSSSFGKNARIHFGQITSPIIFVQSRYLLSVSQEDRLGQLGSLFRLGNFFKQNIRMKKWSELVLFGRGTLMGLLPWALESWSQFFLWVPFFSLLVNFELQNIFVTHYFLLKLARVDFVACNKSFLAEICCSLEHRSELHLYSLQNNQHNYFWMYTSGKILSFRNGFRED